MEEVNKLRRKLLDSPSGPYQELNDKLVNIEADQNLLIMACQSHNLNLVNFLLEQPKALASLNQPEEEFYGKSRYDYPINVACDANALDIVKKLIEVGADLEARDASEATALQRAAFSEKGFDVFLHLCTIEGIDINVKNKNNTSFLSQAISCHNDEVVIKKLLEMGADTTNVDSFGMTALHYACTYGSSVEVFKLLLTLCDVNQKDNKGNSPLHHIVGASHADGLGVVSLEKLNLLLNAPELDKSATNFSGQTALHVACSEGPIQAVDILMNTEGIDKFALDFKGENILHKSICRGDWDLYLKLVHEYGFDPEIKTKDGRGIFHLICEHDVDDFLLRFLKDDDYLSWDQKYKQKKPPRKTAAKINKMLSSVDEKGCTPLHYACAEGSLSVIHILFEFGIDFYKKNLLGKSPLDIAEERGHLDEIYNAFKEFGIS